MQRRIVSKMETEKSHKGSIKSISEKSVELLPMKEGKDAELSEYDPHIHRITAHPTNNFETLAHLLKGCLGTGILAMHQAFHNSGWLNGLISIVLIGFVCTYCFLVLIKAQYRLCKKHRVPLLTYPESMRLALEEGPDCLKKFASSSVAIVDGFLITYQLGVCICYIVFVAENVKQLVDAYWIELDVKIHMLILLGPLIAINCIKNLKLLAPFSTLANVITFVGIGMVCYYIFKEPIPSISTREAFAPISKYPLYFGTTLFALEAVGVVIALENNMEKPKSFSKVLNFGMIIIVILYGGMGFFGYLKYGADSKGSITLNLPQTELLSQATKVIFAIAIFISYALQCYVPVQIIWEHYVSEKYKVSDKSSFYQLALRIVITLITFVFAAGIPRLGLFISLFGAFCLSALGLAFPAIMEMCVLWPDELGKYRYILYKDIFLIFVGLVGLVSGTYTSIRDIIISFM